MGVYHMDLDGISTLDEHLQGMTTLNELQPLVPALEVEVVKCSGVESIPTVTETREAVDRLELELYEAQMRGECNLLALQTWLSRVR